MSFVHDESGSANGVKCHVDGQFRVKNPLSESPGTPVAKASLDRGSSQSREHGNDDARIKQDLPVRKDGNSAVIDQSPVESVTSPGKANRKTRMKRQQKADRSDSPKSGYESLIATGILSQ